MEPPAQLRRRSRRPAPARFAGVISCPRRSAPSKGRSDTGTAWRQDFEAEMRGSRRELQRAARSAFAGWIQDLGAWDLFGGLTFDPRRCRHGLVPNGPCSMERMWADTWVPRLRSVHQVRKAVEAWRERGQEALGRSFEYVAGIEAHTNGHLHVHPLVKLEDGLRFGDIKTLGTLWYERNGYALLEVPRSQADVTAYSAKYLTKDLSIGDLLISPGLAVARQGRAAASSS